MMVSITVSILDDNVSTYWDIGMDTWHYTVCIWLQTLSHYKEWGSSEPTTEKTQAE